jgi:hypothetical protein
MVMTSCGIFLHCPFRVLTRLSLSSSQVGMMMIFSTLHFCSYFPFGSKQRKAWFRMIAPAALRSLSQSTNLCMLMQLRPSNCVSQITHPPLMMGTFHPTYASWAWLTHAVIPGIRRTLGMEVDMAHQVPIQRSPFAACLDAGNHNCTPHQEGRGSGSCLSGNRPYVQGGHGSSQEVAPRGRYARPDKNGRVY